MWKFIGAIGAIEVIRKWAIIDNWLTDKEKYVYIYIIHAIAYNLFSAAVEVKEDENKQLLAQLSELKATSETEVNFDWMIFIFIYNYLDFSSESWASRTEHKTERND